jgi:phospholipid transport system substrate-binding protein
LTRYIAAAVCLVCVYSGPRAWAAGPLDYTRATLAQATAIVTSNQTHDEKLAALSDLFRNFLDTDTMGRQALGAHWASFTPSQQKEFLVLFRELMERTYVAKLLLFDNPKFVFVSTSARGIEARVDTQIVTPNDQFDVVYWLRPDGNSWKATGIEVEGVNLTGNLGNQLNRLLSRMSVPELLDLMERLYGPTRQEASE